MTEPQPPEQPPNGGGPGGTGYGDGGFAEGGPCGEDGSQPHVPPGSQDATEMLPPVPAGPPPPPPTAPSPPPQERTALLPPILDEPPRRRVPVRAWVAAAVIAACALVGLGIGALLIDGDGGGAADSKPRDSAGAPQPSGSPSGSESAGSPSPSPTGPPPVIGGPYLLINADSGAAADVTGSSPDDGAAAIAFKRTGTPNQRWILSDAGGGLVQIKAVHSGKCLQSDPAGPQAPVVQLPCANSDVQKWRLTPEGGGFTLTLDGSTEALGVGPPSGEAGLQPLQLQQPGPGQRWTIATP